MLGGSSDSIWYSIFCRLGTGIRCGVRVLVVAVSIYSNMWFASCFIKCKQSLKFASIVRRWSMMFCTCTRVASWFVMLNNALMSSLDFVNSFKMMFILVYSPGFHSGLGSEWKQCVPLYSIGFPVFQ